MVTGSGSLADILAPGLFKVTDEEYNRHADEHSKILNLVSSDKAYEKTTQLEGFGIAPQKNKGSGTTYYDLTQGYDKTHTNITYSAGLRIEKELYDDDLSGKIKKGAAYVGRSIRQRVETAAANVYNNGFSGSYLGPDSKALFADDHPYASGGTGRNELSTAADLSITSLKQMVADLRSQTDSSGNPYVLKPKTLLVPPELSLTADVLLKSVNEPGSGNNDKNVISNVGLTAMTGNYLTDANAFFIICDMHDAFIWMRQKPTYKTGDDFDTDDVKHKGTVRLVTGWANWPGLFGSQGST